MRDTLRRFGEGTDFSCQFCELAIYCTATACIIPFIFSVLPRVVPSESYRKALRVILILVPARGVDAAHTE